MHDYLLAVRSAEARSESLVCRVDRTARRAVLFRTVGRRCVNGNGRTRPDSLWRPLPAQSRAAVFGLVGAKSPLYSLTQLPRRRAAPTCDKPDFNSSPVKTASTGVSSFV